jgi:hypothetical protein
MKTFNPASSAKLIKQHMKSLKEAVVSVLDDDGTPVIQVKNAETDDTRLDSNEPSNETRTLALRLVAELNTLGVKTQLQY